VQPIWTDIKDAVILVARLFLAALFVIFGWRKVADFSGTMAQMARDRLPLPRLATLIAIGMEVGVASAIAVGLLTRPAAAAFVFYTLRTSLAEHRYWEVKGPQQVELMEAFYKNLSITGGFPLLFVTGAGRDSVDALVWR
jgi:putative oxidoreductase